MSRSAHRCESEREDGDDEGGAGVDMKEGAPRVVPACQVIERLDVNQHIGGAESKEVDLPGRGACSATPRPKWKGVKGMVA